jgi:hypothetical protein
MRLDPALAAFPRSFGPSMHESNHAAWRSLAAAIVDVMPPSLLCAPLVHPKKPTWGFDRLTLCVESCPVVRFGEKLLELVSPVVDSDVHTHTPCFIEDCMYHQTSYRVQDVLWRLGDIFTSPDIALAMLHPTSLSACLLGSPPAHLDSCMQACSDRSWVLSRVACQCASVVPSRPQCPSDYLSFARALESVVPAVATEHFHTPSPCSSGESTSRPGSFSS